jgi:hypothetical protein
MREASKEVEKELDSLQAEIKQLLARKTRRTIRP